MHVISKISRCHLFKGGYVGVLLIGLLCGLFAAPAQAKSPAPAEMTDQSRHEPTGVRAARDWLALYWRDCRKKSYPRDVEAGVDKVVTTARFFRRRRHARAALTILLQAKGKTLKPNRTQKAFIRCVRRRVRRKWLMPHGIDFKATLSLANPFPSEPFVRKGKITMRAAQAYLARQMARIEPACSVKRRDRRSEVMVGVDKKGRVTSIDIDIKRARSARCVRRKFRGQLRFPRSRHYSRVRLDRRLAKRR